MSTDIEQPRIRDMATTDEILSIIENPTRRRILQAVVREPHYPLQLSKEMGISQQAVVKNLNLMEKEGILVSYRESSDKGPDRIFYRPSSEFTITIDMRDNMFRVTMVPAGEKHAEPETQKEPVKTDDERRIEQVRAQIASIDRQVSEFDRKRSELIRRRSEILDAFLKEADLSSLDYPHRQLLYDMLNRPNWSAEDISRNMGFNEAMVNSMIDDILRWYRGGD